MRYITWSFKRREVENIHDLYFKKGQLFAKAIFKRRCLDYDVLYNVYPSKFRLMAPIRRYCVAPKRSFSKRSRTATRF